MYIIVCFELWHKENFHAYYISITKCNAIVVIDYKILVTLYTYSPIINIIKLLDYTFLGCEKITYNFVTLQTKFIKRKCYIQLCNIFR